MNYATIAQAQAYFDGRLGTEAWDTALNIDRLKALTMSTASIDRLNFVGSKNDPLQENQFPRGADLIVPDDIVKACAENALALLKGIDVEDELENLRVSSERYASIGVTYDPRLQSENILAGIASRVAWDYLKPYLRDPRNVGLVRV